MRNISTAELDREIDVLHSLLLAMGRMRSLRDPIAAICETLRFTPPQIHTLLWLGADGPLTMGDLARRNGITEKTVTGIIDRLEREAFVRRCRDLRDRRVVRVELTRKGARVYQKANLQMRQTLGRVLSILDPADRRALFRVLNKLVERLMTNGHPGREVAPA